MATPVELPLEVVVELPPEPLVELPLEPLVELPLEVVVEPPVDPPPFEVLLAVVLELVEVLLPDTGLTGTE